MNSTISERLASNPSQLDQFHRDNPVYSSFLALSPIEKIKAMQDPARFPETFGSSIIHSIFGPITVLHPAIGATLEKQIIDSRRFFDPESQYLGVSFALQMIPWLVGGVRDWKEAGPAIAEMLALCAVEKAIDDLGGLRNVNGVGFSIPHHQIVKQISEAALRLILNPSLIDQEIRNIANLDLGNIQTDLGSVVRGIPSLSGLTSNPEVLPLQMNLVGAAISGQLAGRFKAVPELAKMITEGLSRRYTGIITLYENINVPIGRALELGRDTILTEYVFAAMAAVMMREYHGEELFKNLEFIEKLKEASASASCGIRLHNDLGPVARMKDYKFIELLTSIDPDFRKKYPVEFFAGLKGKLKDKSKQHLLDRLIRDAYGAGISPDGSLNPEYNLFYVPGFVSSMSQGEAWELALANRDAASKALDYHEKRLRRISESMKEYGEAAIRIVAPMQAFLDYNEREYSKGADYDEVIP